MESVKRKTALITGANIGLGKEVAKQLALSGEYRKIYLACRNESKAKLAQIDLERAGGKADFEIIVMDVTNLDSVRTAVASLKSPIDALLMNAGGTGGKTPLALTKDGVTEILASNVLGHVVLLEDLIKAGKLKGTAVLVGSEAARGVPKLGIKRPSLPTFSADEFVSLCKGTYFHEHKFDRMLAYAQVKYIGALWMASAARQYPDVKLITMSPGNTSGTEALRDLPSPLRVIANRVMMPFVAPLLGIAHKTDVGAKRLVDALHSKKLKSGSFYASHAKELIGPVIDQSEIFPELFNRKCQESAFEAIHRFVPA